ncbi:hypothetical protein L0U85_15705 [Glycomyces sp. L485]|uniref:hypothetical protein n=1 Tax=Glycomyces sp. L485 TaxID=2909235 RepID=UPI001F4A5ABD|nr:hypothetical protein [Glycomyces sp. L485]MCH7232289.1 hypothetical protein [Glycomyces sp. L485]
MQVRHARDYGKLQPVEYSRIDGVDGIRYTKRLRLEPVGPVKARDLWLVQSDDGVWPWYAGEKPGLEQAQ